MQRACSLLSVNALLGVFQNLKLKTQHTIYILTSPRGPASLCKLAKQNTRSGNLTIVQCQNILSFPRGDTSLCKLVLVYLCHCSPLGNISLCPANWEMFPMGPAHCSLLTAHCCCLLLLVFPAAWLYNTELSIRKPGHIHWNKSLNFKRLQWITIPIHRNGASLYDDALTPGSSLTFSL